MKFLSETFGKLISSSKIVKTAYKNCIEFNSNKRKKTLQVSSLCVPATYLINWVFIFCPDKTIYSVWNLSSKQESYSKQLSSLFVNLYAVFVPGWSVDACTHVQGAKDTTCSLWDSILMIWLKGEPDKNSFLVLLKANDMCRDPPCITLSGSVRSCVSAAK